MSASNELDLSRDLVGERSEIADPMDVPGGAIVQGWDDFEYVPVQNSQVLTLALSDEFRHVFGLLYAVMKSDERSARALALTSRAIKLNPGNPTAWMLRRESAIALAAANASPIWMKELTFTATIISMNRKVYQAWEHRRFAAERANLLNAEVGYVDIVLSEDAKNYHAWSLRSWLVLKHGIVEGELEATEWFIRNDVRNNSAWNHRWVVTGAIVGSRNVSELKFSLEIMMEAPRNESVWNYIHALGRSGVDTAEAKVKAIECLNVDAGCVAARRFLVLNGSTEEAREVIKHCTVLSGGVDSIRKKYWNAQKEAASRTLEE